MSSGYPSYPSNAYGRGPPQPRPMYPPPTGEMSGMSIGGKFTFIT